MEAILNNMSDGVVVGDATGRLLFFNPMDADRGSGS